MLTAEELERINPRLNVLKNPRSTVYRIIAEQERQIEALWESKRAQYNYNDESIDVGSD